MTGTVKKINRDHGIVAIQTEHGGYSICESRSAGLEIGDHVRWGAFYPAGDATVVNETQHTHVDVVFLNHEVSEGRLRQHISN